MELVVPLPHTKNEGYLELKKGRQLSLAVLGYHSKISPPSSEHFLFLSCANQPQLLPVVQIQMCLHSLELPVVQTVHSAYSGVLDFYRICLTRTATGMKPASTASSARIHWWTNLLLQKRNIYFVPNATPTNTLPNVMSARRLLCQVRMLTFWTKKRLG